MHKKQSIFLSKIKSLDWNRIADILVILYLTKLLFNGYSGGFNASGHGGELEYILRATFITVAYLGTLAYVIFGIIKKVFLAASIILLCSIPLLLIGLLYYTFGTFVEQHTFDTIQSLFLKFTVLQSWLCIHGFSQFRNNTKLQHIVLLLLFLVCVLL